MRNQLVVRGRLEFVHVLEWVGTHPTARYGQLRSREGSGEGGVLSFRGESGSKRSGFAPTLATRFQLLLD
jgi:hypothetical protein